jgi:tetratricopeptide (TPR) repeat protein
LNLGAAQPRPGQSEWIDRLTTWLTAIETHEPGTLDRPALTISQWSRAEFRATCVDAIALARIVRCSCVGAVAGSMRCGGIGCTVSIVLPDGREAPWRSLVKEPKQRVQFEALVKRAGFHLDDVIKRGAILHSDIAMLGRDQGEPVDTPPSLPAPPLSSVATGRAEEARIAQLGPQHLALLHDDGRQQSFNQAAIHWEFARGLLNEVKPEPALDRMVRLWYHAMIAYLQREQQLFGEHFKRAWELFPGDAEVLFQFGVLHETFATDRIQNVVKSAVLPTDVSFDIGSPRGELRQAENLLKRAVEAQPEFPEARLHLGRVSGLLGRHADAVREIETAAAALDDPFLAYFAQLFLGQELESLGQFDASRAAYERAAAAYPHAQSPYLALGHLAQRQGNLAAALKALGLAFEASADDFDRDDPWWSYEMSAGRNADDRFARVYAPFRLESKR